MGRACNLRYASGEEAASVPVSISVVAPGAGTGANGQVYAAIAKQPCFNLSFLGRSRAAYDRYPPSWPEGCSAPNLESFGQAILGQGELEECDCLVFGSRGGQVVLPLFWKAYGPAVPPALVINGGCAMKIPGGASWPNEAVTVLLLGGRDFFRGQASEAAYLHETKACVPEGNSTTAILYVREMEHMPQPQLLSLVMGHLILVLRTWAISGQQAPEDVFHSLMEALLKHGWSGLLLYTRGPGQWVHKSFHIELQQTRARAPNYILKALGCCHWICCISPF